MHDAGHALVESEAAERVALTVEAGQLVALDQAVCRVVPAPRHQRACEQAAQGKLSRRADQRPEMVAAI